MASNPSPTITKRLWHILPLIYYMLRNSISKRKLMMDLQLFFKRGKLAGKALGNIVSFHRQTSRNTTFYLSNKRKNRARQQAEDDFCAGMFAEAFDILNVEELGSSISPAGLWWFGRSPAVVRQLRVSDSPFMVEEEEVVEGKVDKEAEDFIRRFREQLRREKLGYYCGEEI